MSPPRDHQNCKYLIKNKRGKENKQDLKDIYQEKKKICFRQLENYDYFTMIFFKKN